MKFIVQVFLVLSLFVHGFVHGSVMVPSDLRVEKPAADVPVNCARFFSESGWGQGRWNGVLETQFWIEKINPDCTANVVYAWGNAPAWGTTRGFVRTVGRITDNTIRFSFGYSNPLVIVTFTMNEEGSSIGGIWSRGSQSARVTLLRGTAP